MNEFSVNLKQSLKPPYVDKFDLSHHPFTSQFNSALFYENEGREIILKKLSHLIDFTNFILFLQGAEGLGKSTLIRQRIREAKDTWRTCFVNAQDFTNPQSLIEKIATDMRVKLHKKIETQALKEQLEAMRQTGLTPVLFIDDIEEINTAIIPLISELIQHNTDKQPNLRLIIAGQDINDIFMDIIPKDDDKNTLKYLPIPPLSEIETAEYIKHRLHVSNYQYTDPFSKKCLESIYLESKGFPAKINKISDHLFSLYALEYDNRKPLIHLNKNTNRALKYTATGLSLLIIMIVASNFFDSTTDKMERSDTSSMLSLNVPNIKNIQVSDFPLPIKEKEQEPQLKSTPIATPPHIEAKEITTTINNKVEDLSLSDNKKTIASEQPKAKKAIEPVNVKIERKVKTIKQSHAWAKRQASKSYTLQLLGGVNKSSIINFIKQHKIEEHTAIIHSIHKGRNWYSVIYQSFATEKMARQGGKSLPLSLKEIKPWIRPFSVIQKNMR